MSERAPHIDDPTNAYFVHVVARRLLPLAIRWRLHPNLVSVTGLMFAILSGACYHYWQQPLAVFGGFVMMCAWHVCDGLDGQLARATGTASAMGRFVDGACDYLAFFAVLLPVALGFPDWQDKLTLCLTAGAAHAIQSMWFEGERDGWARRAAGVFVVRPRAALGHWAEAGHNAVERALGSRERPVDAVLRRDPARLPAYLGATAPLVRLLQPLSANGRTIALPLACLAGTPVYFWYWELFGLTFYALVIAFMLRRTEARIVADAAPMLDPGAVRFEHR